ncbi:MAG: methyltransferase [Gammaproteobacteria bacterium]|nr:methyltransferase [Gammaproteobacteria bacterium]
MPKRRNRNRSGSENKDVPSTSHYKTMRNCMAPLEILTTEQLEIIHQNSLRILEEIGIEFMGQSARNLFKAAGAVVNEETGQVRIDREIVFDALREVPSSVTLTPRNSSNRMILGGNSICTTSVGGPPNVHDRINGRRRGNFDDYKSLLKLTQSFDIIHGIGNQPTPPMELPAFTRHLDCYLANATYTDKVWLNTSIGEERAMDGINISAISRGLSLDEMAINPSCITVISVNSPRRFDAEMSDGLMAMSRHGQCVAVTPFTLMGAMTPTTLAGALAQQNAEALCGIVLTQLTRPGAPVMYGSFTSNVDMKTGAPAFGTPEYARAAMASGQLARKYGLPFRCSNATASNTVDAQATYESEMSIWSCVMAHSNLLYHAAGWMEGGLTASFEKFVLDAELLQMMAQTVRPIEVNEEQLAYDAISQVPTGGQFFDHPHTLARYKDAFHTPMLSDWRNYEVWELDGEKTATERATETWQACLANYEKPAMDPSIEEELEAYVAKRKEEIKRSL